MPPCYHPGEDAAAITKGFFEAGTQVVKLAAHGTGHRHFQQCIAEAQARPRRQRIDQHSTHGDVFAQSARLELDDRRVESSTR